MIATIAVIAAIAEKKSAAIAAIKAIIRKPLSSDRNDNDRRDIKSTLFSAFSLSRCIEIGHRQSRPVDECSEEKGRVWVGKKIHTGRNLMAGERENARERNTRCCIYTTTLRKIDRMALFIPSHLLLYVRGETAENSTLFSAFSLSRGIEIGHRQSLWLKECPKVP